MPKASDLDMNGPISILLKSPFGFGKTLAACSMAIDGPVHLCFWDKKAPVELVRFFKTYHPEVLDNLTYDVYGSTNAGKYLEFLYSQQKRCDYFGIITDSVTMMTASAVNWSMAFRNPAGGKKDPMNANNPMTIPDFDEYKVETSLVTQALDICRMLPCHIIWTAHPLPSLKIEGGNKMSITKVNNIVSYGQKVGAIVPGQFTEIYHLSKEVEWIGGMSVTKRLVNTVDVGDDFAKSSLGLPAQFDITGKLFWSEWKRVVQEANQ